MKEIPISKIMKKDFVDVPSSTPKVKVPLSVVGIHKRPHYIIVSDPFTKKPVRLMSDIKVSLSLPANQRGLHMSRIEGALHQMDEFKPVDLLAYATKLCRTIKKTQEQKNCRVELVASYEHLVEKNVSKRPSHELLKLHAFAEYIGNKLSISIGITSPFINACPCAQRWGMKDFYNELKRGGYNNKEILSILQKAPLQTHTNRGEATLIVKSDKVDFEDVYKILQNSAPIIRELLSGKDEHAVVRDSHLKGMFCEDVMRSIIANVIASLDKKVSQQTLVEIIVDVDESIHFHNLYSETRDTIKNLKKNLIGRAKRKVKY